jgi:hypothetical protein
MGKKKKEPEKPILPPEPAKVQFVKLPYDMLDSRMWRKELSRVARDLYIQIKARRSRLNKKKEKINTSDNLIVFGYGDSYGMSKPSFVNGIIELRKNGFIKLTHPGGFQRGKSEYALKSTWRQYERGEREIPDKYDVVKKRRSRNGHVLPGFFDELDKLEAEFMSTPDEEGPDDDDFGDEE